MLFGIEPFQGETYEDLKAANKEGVYTFPKVPIVSTDARDWLSLVLQRTPKRRITPDVALQHDWIKSAMPDMKSSRKKGLRGPGCIVS